MQASVQDGSAQGETVYLVESQDGSDGMLQSFRLDNSGLESINALLSRPRTSALDNGWNSWCVHLH